MCRCRRTTLITGKLVGDCTQDSTFREWPGLFSLMSLDRDGGVFLVPEPLFSPHGTRIV